HCGKGPGLQNESTQWTKIGSKPCPSAVLSLAPPSQKRRVHTAATVTATLRNSGGPGCGRPLQGATVRFKVLSGPNSGKTGRSVTNKGGHAQFTYSSKKTGTDALRASTSNPTGTIFSNKVKVIWVQGHRAGKFSCKGTGATVLTLTFAVSNPMDTPCKAHQASVAAVNGKPGVNVTAHVVRSATLIKAGKQAKAGDTARATAKVAKATVGAIPTHNVQ